MTQMTRSSRSIKLVNGSQTESNTGSLCVGRSQQQLNNGPGAGRPGKKTLFLAANTGSHRMKRSPAATQQWPGLRESPTQFVLASNTGIARKPCSLRHMHASGAAAKSGQQHVGMQPRHQPVLDPHTRQHNSRAMLKQPFRDTQHNYSCAAAAGRRR